MTFLSLSPKTTWLKSVGAMLLLASCGEASHDAPALSDGGGLHTRDGAADDPDGSSPPLAADGFKGETDATAIQPGRDAATAQGDAATAKGEATACSQHSDCDGSPEALGLATLRCPSESYCLQGRCQAGCSPTCDDLRDDVSACSAGSFCAPSVGVCRFRPIACETREQCPGFRPTPADGGQAQWACIEGTCSYPGLSL